jgi:hypothetical protein
MHISPGASPAHAHVCMKHELHDTPAHTPPHALQRLWRLYGSCPPHAWSLLPHARRPQRLNSRSAGAQPCNTTAARGAPIGLARCRCMQYIKHGLRSQACVAVHTCCACVGSRTLQGGHGHTTHCGHRCCFLSQRGCVLPQRFCCLLQSVSFLPQCGCVLPRCGCRCLCCYGRQLHIMRHLACSLPCLGWLNGYSGRLAPNTVSWSTNHSSRICTAWVPDVCRCHRCSGCRSQCMSIHARCKQEAYQAQRGSGSQCRCACSVDAYAAVNVHAVSMCMLLLSSSTPVQCR